MIYVPDWTRIGIIAVAAPLINLKAVFAEHRWGLLNHTAPLFAQFSKTKTAINNRALLYNKFRQRRLFSLLQSTYKEISNCYILVTYKL